MGHTLAIDYEKTPNGKFWRAPFYALKNVMAAIWCCHHE
jgi:hypothetical protein